MTKTKTIYTILRFIGALIAMTPFTIMAAEEQTLATVDYVDLDRFMGKWYVIACIPTQLEKNIFNAVETYKRDPDGTVATTFSYNKGGFEGPKKEYQPRGFILDDKTNAVWGMQFIWPIKADYRIIYLDHEYSSTIIGRNKRDYVWILARKPQLSEDLYDKLSEEVERAGYNINKLVKIPHRWK